jgi:superfamily I DNA/RNA helicase
MDKRRYLTFLGKSLSESDEAYAAARLCDIARNVGLGLDGFVSPPDLDEIIDDFDIISDSDVASRIAEHASRAINALSAPGAKSYDFTDMLYLPLKWNLSFPKQKIIFVDELQDTNLVNRLMLQKSLADGGRVIGIGDTHQAIYAWRGADASAMQLARDAFNAHSLPLSITYRCPLRVVEMAQEFVPHLLARPSAPAGRAEWIETLPEIETLSSNDLILCRTNAPLLRLAYRFLKKRLPVRMLGDFGERMISFLKSFKTKDMKLLRAKLEKWHSEEKAKLEAKGRGGRLALLEDKYEAYTFLLETSSSFDDVVNTLTTLFAPRVGCPVLSSIHRAKGTEAHTVYLLNRDQIPSKYAESAASLQQEYNLIYVAYTRAKENLFIIP